MGYAPDPSDVWSPTVAPKPWKLVNAQLYEQLGLHRARLKPFEHQIEGINQIVNKPAFFLADEMGAGKTKQAIDATQILYILGRINQVIVIAPAAVRTVWYDPELGELAKHLWDGIPSEVTEYHARSRSWLWDDDHKNTAPRLQWVVTNYDFLINPTRLAELQKFASGGQTFLILDESSAVKNMSAKRTKACLKLRKVCARVLLMNGMPIANSPQDMFSQGQIMDQAILSCPSIVHFRSRYAVLGGFKFKEVVGWVNLEDLQQRFAPYIIRRLKDDCMDLPPKLPPVILPAVLTDSTWKTYTQMRDDMVTWLSDNDVSIASQAIVKIIRLSQITSGFIGGIEEAIAPSELSEDEPRPNWLEPLPEEPGGEPLPPVAVDGVREIGREKLDAFLDWYKGVLAEVPDLKLIIWSRHLFEIKRLHRELSLLAPTALIIGGTEKKSLEEKDRAKRLLTPATAPKGPANVIGTPSAGGRGLTLVAAHHVMRMSRDYNMESLKQSDDRVHREGQLHAVWYGDIVAVGPKGQKTIDHVILKAHARKEDLAHRTASAWIKDLLEE